MTEAENRRVDLGFEIADRIAARLVRDGMESQQARSVAITDLITARRAGARSVHGVSIARLL